MRKPGYSSLKSLIGIRGRRFPKPWGSRPLMTQENIWVSPSYIKELLGVLSNLWWTKSNNILIVGKPGTSPQPGGSPWLSRLFRLCPSMSYKWLISPNGFVMRFTNVVGISFGEMKQMLRRFTLLTKIPFVIPKRRVALACALGELTLVRHNYRCSSSSFPNINVRRPESELCRSIFSNREIFRSNLNWSVGNDNSVLSQSTINRYCLTLLITV